LLLLLAQSGLSFSTPVTACQTATGCLCCCLCQQYAEVLYKGRRQEYKILIEMTLFSR
jgi:G3E family GTPase